MNDVNRNSKFSKNRRRRVFSKKKFRTVELNPSVVQRAQNPWFCRMKTYTFDTKTFLLKFHQHLTRTRRHFSTLSLSLSLSQSQDFETQMCGEESIRFSKEECVCRMKTDTFDTKTFCLEFHQHLTRTRRHFSTLSLSLSKI